LVPWLIRDSSYYVDSIAEIPLPATADCTHEEAFNKIEDLKGLPLNVEKWIRMKDGKGKLKLLQRAQRIYTCRDKTEDKNRVFNFGILTSLKSEFCEREISDLTLWKVVTIVKLIYTMVSLLESVSLFFLIYRIIG
jgi:hypothetical protein